MKAKGDSRPFFLTDGESLCFPEFLLEEDLTQFITKTGSENHTTLVDRPHN
jgi:hypothetical protein